MLGFALIHALFSHVSHLFAPLLKFVVVLVHQPLKEGWEPGQSYKKPSDKAIWLYFYIITCSRRAWMPWRKPEMATASFSSCHLCLHRGLKDTWNKNLSFKLISHLAPRHWYRRALYSPLPGSYTPTCRHFGSSGSLYCTLAFLSGTSLSQLETINTKKKSNNFEKDATYTDMNLNSVNGKTQFIFNKSWTSVKHFTWFTICFFKVK